MRLQSLEAVCWNAIIQSIGVFSATTASLSDYSSIEEELVFVFVEFVPTLSMLTVPTMAVIGLVFLSFARLD
jgi:hypothetical protein